MTNDNGNIVNFGINVYLQLFCMRLIVISLLLKQYIHCSASGTQSVQQIRFEADKVSNKSDCY